MKMTEKDKLGLHTFPIEKSDKAIRIRGNGKLGFFVLLTCKFIKPNYHYAGGFKEGRASVMIYRIIYDPNPINILKWGKVDIHGNETWDN